MGSDDAAFDELIEKSSLGTPGARQLRARTSESHADVVRQIIKLRNVMAHGSRDETVGAANTLLQLFGDLGYDEQVQRVLAEAFPGREAETVLTMARLIADSRQASQQKAQPAGDRRRRAGNDAEGHTADLETRIRDAGGRLDVEDDSDGQPPLSGLELPGPGLDGATAAQGQADDELGAVEAELRRLDPDGSRLAAAIRGALDMLLDGQHTGRYRWDQLHKTEKTHAGTLVEIALARALRLADGTALDYTIAGADVDCKFSHRLGGWMIPPEADGKLMLLVQASDEDGTWSAGLVRAAPENLSPAGNRDGKRALNERGRAAVCWLHARVPLQENVLIRLPEADVAAIFAAGSGQQRVNELFRRAQRMRVSRTVVATVAMQDDYMKRVRGGGGARDQLRAEGIVIFGDYAGDQLLAAALGLPRPGPGEFVSARLVPRPAGAGPGGAARDRDYARFIRLAGADWRLASAADPPAPAPALPR